MSLKIVVEDTSEESPGLTRRLLLMQLKRLTVEDASLNSPSMDDWNCSIAFIRPLNLDISLPSNILDFKSPCRSWNSKPVRRQWNSKLARRRWISNRLADLKLSRYRLVSSHLAVDGSQIASPILNCLVIDWSPVTSPLMDLAIDGSRIASLLKQLLLDARNLGGPASKSIRNPMRFYRFQGVVYKETTNWLGDDKGKI